MVNYYVYVLRSEKSGRFYVGMSDNVDRRISEHNNGKVFSTKGYVPWQLIRKEKYNSRKEARDREKYLQSGSGKEKIKLDWLRNENKLVP